MADISDLPVDAAGVAVQGGELIPALRPDGSGGWVPVALTPAQFPLSVAKLQSGGSSLAFDAVVAGSNVALAVSNGTLEIAAIAGVGGGEAVTNQATITIAAGGTHTLSGGDVATTVVALIAGDARVNMPASGQITFVPITQRPALPALSGAKLNPADVSSYAALSNGNLTLTNATGNPNWAVARADTAVVNGATKYFEIALDTIAAGDFALGFMPIGGSIGSPPGVPNGVSWGHDQGGGDAFYYLSNTNLGAPYLALTTSSGGTRLGFWIDRVHQKVWLHDVNGWVGSGGNASGGAHQDPYTNAGGFDISSLGTVDLYPAVGLYRLHTQVTMNFDAPFHYSGGPATLTVSNGYGTVAFSASKQVVAIGALGVSLL